MPQCGNQLQPFDFIYFIFGICSKNAIYRHRSDVKVRKNYSVYRSKKYTGGYILST